MLSFVVVSATFDVQLLNQWESPGSPPASKDDIDSLAVVTIAQEHIGVCTYQPIFLSLSYLCV